MVATFTEVSAFAFVLELPWAVGVPDDYVLNRPVARERPASLGSTSSPLCRLRFRTVDVPTQLPLAASDLAFGGFDRDAEASEEEKIRREEVTEGIVAKPFLERRTVVVAYVSSDEDPPRLESEPLSKALTVALGGLNAWLISVGILYNDRLRPISLGDLPPAVPVMRARLVGTEFEHGPSELFELRKQHEPPRMYGEQELERAERILMIVASEEGLSTFYELVGRAGSARRAHRHREAVIDYATAGELFITAMLEALGKRCGVENTTLANLLTGSFKDRARHLCRLLGVPEDPGDSDSPLFYWWLHCYRQRNWIVHEGADSMAGLSEVARIGLVQMVVEIREAIRADAELADLASMILWGRRVDHTSSGGDSEPDPPPPVAAA